MYTTSAGHNMVGRNSGEICLHPSPDIGGVSEDEEDSGLPVSLLRFGIASGDAFSPEQGFGLKAEHLERSCIGLSSVDSQSYDLDPDLRLFRLSRIWDTVATKPPHRC